MSGILANAKGVGGGIVACFALLASPMSAADAREAEAIDADQAAVAISSAETAPVISISRTSDLVGSPVLPILSGQSGASGLAALSRLPFAASRISSRFGQRLHPVLRRWQSHAGVDFAAPTGTPVSATGGGTVTRAGWAGNYGYLVVIDHGDGVETRYAHMSRIDVRRGDSVGAGHRLGAVGSTGRSTGPHLHYEVRLNGRAVDPLL